MVGRRIIDDPEPGPGTAALINDSRMEEDYQEDHKSPQVVQPIDPVSFVGFISWFIFSWGIHQPRPYRFGFVNQVPKLMRLILLYANGKRTRDGVLHHASHHAWSRVPSSRLHDFDEAAVRNPEAIPNPIPTKK